MKLALFFTALAGTSTALKCTAQRGPRPDDVEQQPQVGTTTAPEIWRQATTQYWVEPNSHTKQPPSNEDCTCGIEDYNDPSVSSWRTNCPSGCAIYQYLDEVEDKLNDDWKQLEVRINAQLRAGVGEDLHLTLSQILEKIKEALRTIKKEKDQLLAIQRIYRNGGIADIINEQRLKLAELTATKSRLQIELSNKQKAFKEQAGFCKVSFKQYDEEVCDILSYAKNY